ncbi:Hypothetical protein POVR1_LOCUS566 [uncultured virus]|nr:Hypothetical protein POVR1_LOCUS566 [uncultured virus]
MLNDPETLERLAIHHSIQSQGKIKKPESFCDFILELDLRNDPSRIFLSEDRKAFWCMKDGNVNLLSTLGDEFVHPERLIMIAALIKDEKVRQSIDDFMQCDEIKISRQYLTEEVINPVHNLTNLRLALIGKQLENLKKLILCRGYGFFNNINAELAYLFTQFQGETDLFRIQAILNWGLEAKQISPQSIISAALEAGNIEILKTYASVEQLEEMNFILRVAGKCQNLSAIKYLEEIVPEKAKNHSTDVINGAIECDNLEVFKYLIVKTPVNMYMILFQILEANSINILAWLVKNCKIDLDLLKGALLMMQVKRSDNLAIRWLQCHLGKDAYVIAE